MLDPALIIVYSLGVVSFFGILEMVVSKRICRNCCKRRRNSVAVSYQELLIKKLDYKNYLDYECSICLDGFGKKNEPFSIEFCESDKHPFHKECITSVFQNFDLSCPVCRRRFR